MKAACSGWSSASLPSPSIVVSSAPAWATASARQLFARRPSMRIVHEPHWPWSQPFFAPVRPSCSRRRSSSVVRVSTVRRCSAPLMVSVTSASIGGGRLPRECCGYGLGHEAWLKDHLTPGEAEGSEPQHREARVAFAVFFERGRRQVDGSAVGLHDELLGAPEEVDFVGADDR